MRVKLAAGDEREQFSLQLLAALAAMDGAHGNGSFWQMVRAG
jgi:arginine/ornithine N-succinyltransferase beta subunit